ncbi:Golgi-associated plant pathogenesis-related protein 1-like [Actinia tenebrosa]|uniref:Golgi-associated plant pathogenesis-related protein 1-like n=1 Tax=Actinia tenebrosa TaxID=6105 RepID=A0A6P8I227_ACTTE|nr:Golgi-associated plant pathogenesis-related protein 1-like [Actinia tenebrosa]
MNFWTRLVLVMAILGHYKVTVLSKAKEGCGDTCQKECLSVHNEYRANYGAQRLELDGRLAAQAQEKIDRGVLAHSQSIKSKGGESIAWGSLFPTFTSAIKSWHDEKVNFDFEDPKPLSEGKVVRNFLQIVWKGTRKIGCARGPLYGKPWYVVHYDIAPSQGDAAAIRENVGKPKEDDMGWFRDSSPFAQDFENPRQV